MTRALITGGGGFAGRHLRTHLVGLGHTVEVFDRRTCGGDVRDYEQVRSAVERFQPDRIFHLAGQAFVPESTTDPRRSVDVHVVGTLNVLEAVRQTGSRAKILLAGTSAEYGYDPNADVIDEECVPRPDTAYGVTKLAAGQLGLAYSRTYGISVVVTRAFNHTGPGHPSVYAVPSFARQVAEIERGTRARLRHGNLQARRNYTDVRDVVRAYELAIDMTPDVYNVCSENDVALGDVLDALCALSRVEITTEIDHNLYRPGYQRGLEKTPRPSHDKLTLLAGWVPEVPLRTTLLDTLDYWRSRV